MGLFSADGHGLDLITCEGIAVHVGLLLVSSSCSALVVMSWGFARRNTNAVHVCLLLVSCSCSALVVMSCGIAL